MNIAEPASGLAASPPTNAAGFFAANAIVSTTAPSTLQRQ